MVTLFLSLWKYADQERRGNSLSISHFLEVQVSSCNQTVYQSRGRGFHHCKTTVHNDAAVTLRVAANDFSCFATYGTCSEMTSLWSKWPCGFLETLGARSSSYWKTSWRQLLDWKRGMKQERLASDRSHWTGWGVLILFCRCGARTLLFPVTFRLDCRIWPWEYRKWIIFLVWEVQISAQQPLDDPPVTSSDLRYLWLFCWRFFFTRCCVSNTQRAGWRLTKLLCSHLLSAMRCWELLINIYQMAKRGQNVNTRTSMVTVFVDLWKQRHLKQRLLSFLMNAGHSLEVVAVFCTSNT